MEAVKEGIRSAGWEARLRLALAGRSICPADARQESRPHHGRDSDAGARHRRQHGDFQPDRCRHAANAARRRNPTSWCRCKRHDPRSGGRGRPESSPIRLWEQLRDRRTSSPASSPGARTQFDLAQGGAVHYANGIWVSGDFFKTLGLRPAAGRLIAASDDRRGCPAVAVLSYGFWQDHYGGANSAIGSILSLDTHPFEVIGVAPPGFYGMDVGQKFDVAIPICATAPFDGKESRLDHRSWWWLSVAGRIKPGMSRAQLTARLKVLSPRSSPPPCRRIGRPRGSEPSSRETLVADAAATGISALRRQFDQPLRDPDGRGRTGAADRLRQHRQPDAGPRRRAAQGDRGAAGLGRQPLAADPPVADRVHPALFGRGAAGNPFRALGHRPAGSLHLYHAGTRCSWIFRSTAASWDSRPALPFSPAFCSACCRRSAPRGYR